MLPNINTNPTTNEADPMKQIASVRSQLAMLKEAIEDDLQNISYDNLNLALRKKIDSIDEIKVFAQEQNNIVAQTITADMLLVRGDIQSINGNISSINGSISTINGDISTIKGNISTINGNISTVNGNITTINGDITAINGTVSGLQGEFNDLKAVAVTTSTLSSQLSALQYVSIKSMTLSNGITVTYGGRSLTLNPMILNGYVVLGVNYNG